MRGTALEALQRAQRSGGTVDAVFRGSMSVDEAVDATPPWLLFMAFAGHSAELQSKGLQMLRQALQVGGRETPLVTEFVNQLSRLSKNLPAAGVSF